MRREIAETAGRIGAVVVAFAACSAPSPSCPRDREPSKRESAPAAPAASKPTPPPGGRSLVVEVSATLPAVRLSFTATGPAEELTRWVVGDEVPEKPSVHDGAGGELKSTLSNHILTIEGHPKDVVVAFDLPPHTGGDDPLSSIVEEARFRISGEHVAALPAAFADKPIALSLAVDAKAKAGQVAGSSFGFGHERSSKTVAVPGAALAGLTFVGGAGGHAFFDAPEGEDEAAWLGYTAFDPRSVGAEVAVFRGLLHDHFRGKGSDPSTLTLVVDARPKGHYRVTRRNGGVLVALSGNDAFDAWLRLAVGHELVHAWIGDRLWLGDGAKGQEAKTYWFHEGVARWVAREQLYRAGLLSPEEYAAEMNRLVAVLATSTHTTKTHEELLAIAKEPGVAPVLIARGTLYATAIDARIRDATAQKKSLDDVLRALVVAAESKRRLPEEAFHAAISAEVPPAKAKQTWDDILVRGKRAAIEASFLGTCFEMKDGSYDIYEPGFDVRASRETGTITGVKKGGPSDVAGLKEGDKVGRIDEPTDAVPLMRVEVQRSGAPVTIPAYRAATQTARGPQFKRRAGLTDEACRRLSLRK